MTVNGWCQIGLFVVAVGLLTRPMGEYMFRCFAGDRRPLPRVLGTLERFLYRCAGVDPAVEQTWGEYTRALLVFSVLGIGVTYAIERVQDLLPFNPQGLGPVARALALNTAISFVTNTNWQAYAGESTLSYLTQMTVLTWQNFVSAAAGLGVALALARGVTRPPVANGTGTVGNFWADVVRAVVYVLLPGATIAAVLLVATGVIQTLAPALTVTTLEGARQTLPMGPVASQEAIKLFGVNGGGFFNANSAHPFENPTGTSNLLEMILIFAIPAGLTYTFGRMARDQRQGWTLFAAMALLFLVGVTVAYSAESRGIAAASGLSVDQTAGNMEGKEVRFGVANSALFATITTGASCGAVNAMHDSFTPIGGLVPLLNIQLGEVIFGGVGAGLYGMLVFAILAVFVAGLMVGRTPEYLGKKIEEHEVKLATLYVLVFPLAVLVFAAAAVVLPGPAASILNAGPHGLSEVLYAYSSAAGNNGSAFAGLNANTVWWNLTTGLAMLAGRFLMMVPVLAMAGSLAGKKVVPAGSGTFPTTGLLFVVLLVAVIVVVGALTFFPALALGPVLEQFQVGGGRVF